MSAESLWNVYTAAAWLNRAARWVEREARAGRIPARELPNGELVFSPAELLAWAETLPRPRRSEPVSA